MQSYHTDSTPTARMTEEKFRFWFLEIFARETRELVKKRMDSSTTRLHENFAKLPEALPATNFLIN